MIKSPYLLAMACSFHQTKIKSSMTKSHDIMLRPQTLIGWFQKISIPIPRAASRNSEGEGGLRRLEFRGHGGLHRLEFRGHGGGGSLDWNSEGIQGVFRRVTSSLV